MCICMYVFVCVYVTPAYTHIIVRVYICMCVCMYLTPVYTPSMVRVWAWSVVVMVGVAAVAAAGGTEQVEESGREAARPRRAPSGFLGMRGKKEAPTPSLQADQANTEDLLPALYQLDMPMRGKVTW